MTEPRSDWITTGLYWHRNSAALTFANPDGDTDEQPVSPGAEFAWQAVPPRRCVGLWQPAARRQLPCPHRQLVVDTAGPQCPACAAADPGRALAQDRAVDDDRQFVLYLAWFGGQLFKVGITAAERGTDRLAEQGAIAFTGLARGPLAPIRTAEHRAALAGLARERITWPAKIAHWWTLPDPATRRDTVQAAHDRLQQAGNWPDTVQPLPCRVTDQTALFGLDKPPPPAYHRLARIRAENRLTGRVAALVGPQLLLDTGGRTGHLLADLRATAGWRRPTVPARPATALDLGPLEHPDTGNRHALDTLF